jgi:hemolysin activation/secretion protein
MERSPKAQDNGLRVDHWRFEGNTAIDDEELDEVLQRFTGRTLEPGELEAARDQVTLHYARAGYFTSGAVIPEQDVVDGEILIQVVEGQLSDVHIEGERFFREDYLRRRLALAGSQPLHVPTLERRIRLFQQDRRFERIDARIRPGARLGEARLDLTVREAPPIRAALSVDNHIAPSLGDFRGRVALGNENLAGFGDELTLLVGGYEAGPEFESHYEIPITSWDTTLRIGGRYSESDLVDSVGTALDIQGEFWTAEIELRQPVFRTPELEIGVGVLGAVRESDTEILGIEFNEVGPRTRVTVVRLYQDALWRGSDHVISGRSTLSIGVDLFNPTHSRRSDVPDGQFVSWLGQLQWVQRFSPWALEWLVRGEVQLSEDPLLSIEQYASGGHATVRGYRENQLVRDQGFAASVELRVPLVKRSVDRTVLLQIAPFFDVGSAWNRNRPTASPTTLYSSGLALRMRPTPWLRAEMTWAKRLADVERPDGLQGDGFQFRIVMDWTNSFSN